MAEKRNQSALISRLEALRSHDNGVLLPEAVIQEALGKGKKFYEDWLPGHFWDNAKCAHEHRLSLVRNLVANVRDVSVHSESSVIVAPYYVRDPKCGTKQGYGRLAEIKSDRENAIEVLREEFGRAIAMLERALNVAEIVGLREETEALLTRIKSMKLKLVA